MCVSAHVHTHACITEWLIQPTWPAGDFPGCSGVAQCATRPPIEGGGGSSAPGLAGRLDASWHVAESVILRG